MQEMMRLTQCTETRIDARWTGKRLIGCILSSISQRLPKSNRLAIPIGLAVFLVLWQAIVWIGHYPTFILPTPVDVIAAAQHAIVGGTLWHHARVTLSEVFIGLGLGLVAAAAVGYPLAKSKRLEQLVAPYLVASQSVPVVAIAPLLVIWFGSGSLSKVLICGLIVFFPLLVNIMIGIRSVPVELRDLMESLKANRWQTFWILEVPAALPVIFGGLRIGVTLAVVGAVVGEFVGADQGLGFLINQARGLFDTPMVFVAVFSLVAIAMMLYGLVMLLEWQLLKWRT